MDCIAQQQQLFNKVQYSLIRKKRVVVIEWLNAMHVACSRAQIGQAQARICNGCMAGLPAARALLSGCWLIFQNANKPAVHGCSHFYLGITKQEVSQQYCNTANTQSLATMLSTSVRPLLAMQHTWHTSTRCHCCAAMPSLLQTAAQEVQLHERCAVS